MTGLFCRLCSEPFASPGSVCTGSSRNHSAPLRVVSQDCWLSPVLTYSVLISNA